MLTVICHIYNEEFLLPHWIKHHRTMFDHGIIIDYQSTDNSVQIAKELVPEWTVVSSRNSHFVEPDIGNEVEDYEKSLTGWKMALNVTEFLLHPDLKAYCRTLEDHELAGIRTNGVVIVDHPTRQGITQEPLLKQKTFGYLERDVLIRPSTTRRPVTSRSRLLHRSDCGHYSLGRHSNGVTDRIDPMLFLCWLGWAPFNDQFKARKMQIQTKASAEQHQNKEWSNLYVLDDAKIESMYREEASRSYDLLTLENYRTVFDNVFGPKI